MKMCSIEGDIEDIDLLGAGCEKDARNMIKKSSFVKSICRKCDKAAVILLQKKDPMCGECFNVYFHHKFKAIIGKSKLIRPGSKVLIAYSGGSCSAAMLHVIKQALSEASKSQKKLIFEPGVLHIDESFIVSPEKEKYEISKEILDTVTESKYPAIFSSLEMALRGDEMEDFYSDSILKREIFTSLVLKGKMLKNLSEVKSLSYKQELVDCLRLQLIKDIAKDSGYTHVFVGDSATNLAIKLLAGVSMGKGVQISHNSAFCDTRSDVPVCRPMREFLNKEITCFNHLNKIPFLVNPTLLTMTGVDLSIQRLTEQFVCGLQENFPATIFTIFRTGGKLSTANRVKVTDKCLICDSTRDNARRELCSALEALLITSKLSNRKSSTVNENEFNIHCHVCHACSIMLGEMENVKDIQDSFHRKLEPTNVRSKMYEEIKDFILDVEDKKL